MTGRVDVAQDEGFVEVGDRCWVARFAFLDLNVGVVAGERGLLVVDTHAGEPQARAVVEQLRRLGHGEVVAVVNTHDHFDHTFGNAVLVEEYDGVELFAHEAAAEALAASGPAARDRAAQQLSRPGSDPTWADVAAARVVVPPTTFSSARVVDLGDRVVEVVHLGRGHTAGDAVVRVPDADVLFAGDLVEESADRQNTPGFGEDCFPLDWPATLDLVIGLLTPGSLVVPGHGSPVDRAFVQDQQGDLGVVAEQIRELAARGVRAEEMAAAATWPYPAGELTAAFARGVAMLPRSGRALPMA